MIIALASPHVARTLEEGLGKIERFLAEASSRHAEIVCFPEAYLPGLRGADFDVVPFDENDYHRTLEAVARLARRYQTAVILGTEQHTQAGRLNVAVIFDRAGELLGIQTKIQVAPAEDPFYVAGTGRQLFEVGGVKFGVAICHEGFRYPETVRWAAMRGAKIVFHPHQTGSDRHGSALTQWGAADAPYYEKAMMMRAIENEIYFASVNYALRFAESATSIIDPSGKCQAYLNYGQEGLLVAAIDVSKATGSYAARYAPQRYHDLVSDCTLSEEKLSQESPAGRNNWDNCSTPGVVIETMHATDWEQVRRIYLEGLATGQASFETDAPSWEQWNESRLTHSRLVARENGRVIGWAALSPVSKRSCYAGVAEASIYVAADARGRRVGKALLERLIQDSESNGIWSLYGSTFAENEASIRMQVACGFRIVGRRKRIAQHHGVWRDTIVTERRSPAVGADRSPTNDRKSAPCEPSSSVGP